MGKKGFKPSEDVQLLTASDVDECKAKCDSMNMQCDGIEWYPLRDVYDEHYVSKAEAKAARAAGRDEVPDWDGKGWRKQPNGLPNCVLQNNNIGEWITQSSGLAVKKKDLANTVECYGKNEDWVVTTEAPMTPTTTTADPIAEWTESTKAYVFVGKGSCKGKSKVKTKLMHSLKKQKNVQTVDDCAAKCDDEGDLCIGFNFKPNVKVVTDGKWRKAKKGQPNCKLLTLTREVKGAIMSEVVGSSGKPKKVTKPNYTLCYSKKITQQAPAPYPICDGNPDPRGCENFSIDACTQPGAIGKAASKECKVLCSTCITPPTPTPA